MKYANCMYAWNPKGEIVVGPHPDKTGWSNSFLYSSGSCVLHTKKMTDIEKQHFILSDFVAIVIRDGVNPKAVHEAFLTIDEYRNAIPEDVPTK